MAKIALCRVDGRMVHGQVATNWVGFTHSQRIIIIDDTVAADPFMTQVMEMAAPSQTVLSVYTVAKAVEEWKKDEFGPKGPVMIIFKTIATAYEAFRQGFNFKELMVGGVPSGNGRIKVHGPIHIDQDEAKMLNELDQLGVYVYFKVVLNTNHEDWSIVKKRHFPNM
ncbi:PTS mannose/fructose/sorbose transporter subunit IIB [Ruminococcus sp. AF14-10]|nr:PTS mannose/fructose/sorbose transporter subunit IIB [Ruminococcus sp. AF14-10]